MLLARRFRIILLALPAALLSLHAQGRTLPNTQPNNFPTLNTPGQRPNSLPPPPIDNFPNNAELRARLENARKVDRKKRMVDNANRLLELSRQYQADLNAGVSSPEDDRRLEEIAKLARAVKDQMRQ
jgi:hypothetical protein